MKKLVALVMAVVFSMVYSALPVLAGDGPAPATELTAAPVSAPVVSADTSGRPWWRPAPVAGKDPIKAGLMSTVVPGLGQWYNGQLLHYKTAAMIACEAGSIFVLAFFAAGGAGNGAKMVCMAGAGGMIGTAAWSGIDAWYSAKRANEGLALRLDKNTTMVSYNVPF